MASEDTRTTRDRVASRNGATCIFREKIFIFPCMVDSSRSDSWGVRLRLHPVERNGFIYLGRTPLDISVAWGWGSIGELVWSGGQAGWTLYFDEDLMRSLEGVASGACGLDARERWRRLASHINESQERLY